MAGAGSSGGGSGGGSRAVRAGRAFVELFAEDNKVYRALDRLKSRFQQFGGFVAKSGAALGAAGLSVLTPLKPAIDSIQELGQQGQMAQGLGLSAERFTGLAGAFDRFGIDAQGTVDVLSDVSDWVQDAAVNGGELAETFKFMGLNAKNLMGLKPDQQFAAIADALKKLDPTLAAGLAARLGGDFQKLLPLLRQGSGAIDDLASQFSVSAADVNKAAEANKAYQDATGALSRIWREVVIAVAPAVTEFSRELEKALKVVLEFVRGNRDTIGVVVRVAGGLVAAGAALTGLGLAVSAAGTAIGVVVAAFKAVAVVIGALISPVGLVVAGFAAITAGLVYLASQTSAGAEFFGWIKGGFEDVAEYAKISWAAIGDAIKAGDFKLAGEIALAGLKTAWGQLWLTLQYAWIGFKARFLDGWKDLTEGIQLGMQIALLRVIKAVASALDRVLAEFAGVARAFGFEDLAKAATDARTEVGLYGQAAKKVEGDLVAAAAARKAERDKARKDEAQAATNAFADQIRSLGALRMAAQKAIADSAAFDKAAKLAQILPSILFAQAGAARSALYAGSLGSFTGASSAGRFGGDRAVQKKIADVADNTAETVKAIARLAKSLTFK